MNDLLRDLKWKEFDPNDPVPETKLPEVKWSPCCTFIGLVSGPCFNKASTSDSWKTKNYGVRRKRDMESGKAKYCDYHLAILEGSDYTDAAPVMNKLMNKWSRLMEVNE